MNQETSFAQDAGQKQNNGADAIQRAFHADISSVIAEYKIHERVNMHPEILALHMIRSLDQLLMTLATQAQLNKHNQSSQSSQGETNV